jgi:hypothetical protein
MVETTEVTDEQLALLLEASRAFAFQQLGEAGHFIPFGTQARPDGEVEFVRMLDERMESLEDVFNLLQLALTERAQQGEVLAAATVVNIMVEGMGVEVEPGFERAIRVHVEAPGYSRAVLAPYRFEDADENSDKPYLIDGKMVAFPEPPVIFAG